jgi:hypothetical protein
VKYRQIAKINGEVSRASVMEVASEASFFVNDMVLIMVGIRAKLLKKAIIMLIIISAMKCTPLHVTPAVVRCVTCNNYNPMLLGNKPSEII